MRGVSDDLYPAVMNSARKKMRIIRRKRLWQVIASGEDYERWQYAMDRVAVRDAMEIIIYGSKMINPTANVRRVSWIANRLNNLNRKYANHE